MKVTLEQIHEEILALREDVDKILNHFEDGELSDEAKVSVEESRRRSSDSFKTQEDIEKKFL